MTDRELILACPTLLGCMRGANQPKQMLKELRLIRRERDAGDQLRMKAEFEFRPKRRGVRWDVFKLRYERSGPPGYFDV